MNGMAVFARKTIFCNAKHSNWPTTIQIWSRYGSNGSNGINGSKAKDKTTCNFMGLASSIAIAGTGPATSLG
ncbi:hypothetical protein ACO0LM_03180 [Undibacterium sp. Di26W]|uniref:hypothetical protein n=1 Tax=Undibacterium sp. Di26W TaxID=3413035 RepID=UPI003BF17D71